MKQIITAIVDDDTLVTKLLESYLNNQENIVVDFTAENGNELLVKLQESVKLPDVVLLDLKMKEMDGTEITRILKSEYPCIKIMVMSSHYQKTFLDFMIKSGVAAFIPKGISPTLLIKAIETVHKNGVYFLDDQITNIKEEINNEEELTILEDDKLLTEREKEILRLISMQKTAKEIGEILTITPRTVEGHKNNIFIKTGTKNIAGLVIYAIQHHIVTTEELPLI
ncbi:response regulator transcription factor [Flavobacterium rakeshii]|uniref:response regulator transcription factor n=1 Tax=Flavobacterium rakeshii TaxID=1038845 RepID=UPI002E7B1793|nr:response regulator transcription factor [Flavobacterium rakeshii]MEE1898313.1 response regulator transcription factor [Flavobacterium rakeshii]